MSPVYFGTCLLLMLTFHIIHCTKANSKDFRENYNSQGINNRQERSSSSDKNRGYGISAWGLIFLILLCILAGVAIYYVAIFYPLLCKKERMYDRIELATV